LGQWADRFDAEPTVIPLPDVVAKAIWSSRTARLSCSSGSSAESITVARDDDAHLGRHLERLPWHDPEGDDDPRRSTAGAQASATQRRPRAAVMGRFRFR